MTSKLVLPTKNLIRAVHTIPAGVRSASASRAVQTGGDGRTLRLQWSVSDVWTEIDSWYEGNFMERIAPGACKKTIAEDRDGMRILLQHGRDPQLGQKPIAPVDLVEENAIGGYAEGRLFDGVPQLVVDGLRAGQYGASFRFAVMHEEIVQEPEPSDYNPKGIPERTIMEMCVREFGPVTWGAYPDASAGVRGMTPDDIELAREIEVRRRRLADLDSEGRARRPRRRALRGGSKVEKVVAMAGFMVEWREDWPLIELPQIKDAPVEGQYVDIRKGDAIPSDHPIVLTHGSKFRAEDAGRSAGTMPAQPAVRAWDGELRADVTCKQPITLRPAVRRAIEDDVRASDDRETGGVLLSTRRPAQWRPLEVTEAGTAGVLARSTPTSLYPDTFHDSRSEDNYARAMGCESYRCGYFHSHPTTDDGTPSDADLRTSEAMMRQAGLTCFAMVIACPDKERGWRKPVLHGWMVRDGAGFNGRTVCERATVA